ncbi:hypothetical protein Hdeb2414_s0006g00222611 [Helianthus debilis subsp. tardiflorus]
MLLFVIFNFIYFFKTHHLSFLPKSSYISFHASVCFIMAGKYVIQAWHSFKSRPPDLDHTYSMKGASNKQ